jgi:hypothetical protein
LWSGLEWHDISASGFPGPTEVVSLGGSLYGNAVFAGARSGIWTSPDGSTWTQIAGAPVLSSLVSAGTWLFGLSVDDQALWYSSDGTTWKTAKVSFPPNQDQTRTGVHAGQAIMLTDTVGPTGDTFTSPSDMYRSSDGANWQKVTLPSDMAAALQSTVETTSAGYLVTGFIVDPAGSGDLSGVTNKSSYDYRGFYRSWFSSDAITWSAVATVSDPSSGRSYAGELGYERIGFPTMHSTDGVHWTEDVDDLMQDLRGGGGTNSDGRRILVQRGDSTFYVGLGDGRWQLLRNVGDVAGGLPTPGTSWVVPGGVLYVAGSQVFFGKALTGTVDAPTLAPGPLITEPPYPSMQPRPSVSLPPVSAWSGLGSLQALPSGPVDADYVVTWAHGYAAVHNPPASGGQMTIWLSTDGKTWTVVPSSVYGTATSAIPVAAGGSLILDQSNGGNDMLLTTDGVTWGTVWGGRPPLGDRMVGDARGAIFAAPDPEFQITFNANGIDPDATWRGTTLPNGNVDTEGLERDMGAGGVDFHGRRDMGRVHGRAFAWRRFHQGLRRSRGLRRDQQADCRGKRRCVALDLARRQVVAAGHFRAARTGGDLFLGRLAHRRLQRWRWPGLLVLIERRGLDEPGDPRRHFAARGGGVSAPRLPARGRRALRYAGRRMARHGRAVARRVWAGPWRSSGRPRPVSLESSRPCATIAAFTAVTERSSVEIRR